MSGRPELLDVVAATGTIVHMLGPDHALVEFEEGELAAIPLSKLTVTWKCRRSSSPESTKEEERDEK